MFNPIRSPDKVGVCSAITSKNSNLEEEVSTRCSKKGRMKLPPEKLENNKEQGKSIKKLLSHLQEPQRKTKKKN